MSRENAILELAKFENGKMADSPKLTIIIKTLKAQKHNLEVVLEQNVAALKKQIETDLKLGEASAMKLIHHGKILKDDQVLNSIGLKEGDFVVLMTTKKKKSAKPPAATTQPQPTQPASTTSTSSNTETSTQASSTPSNNTSAPPASSTSNTSAPSSAAPMSGASALVPPGQMQEAIDNLVNMGFPESECRAALQAAFNNPDRAVEYLINGIPESARQAPPPVAPGPATTGDTGGTPATGSSASVPTSGNVVQNILQSLLQNPQLLTTILQVIHDIRPQEHQAILAGFNNRSNPQQAITRFAALMNDTEVLQRVVAALIGIASGGGMSGPGGPPGGGPRVQRVSVSQDELNQIQGLTRTLGIPEDMALRFYLQAGRNADMAASLALAATGGMGLPVQQNQPSGGSNANADSGSNPVQANTNASESNSMEVEENNDASNDTDANNNDDEANNGGPAPDSGANSNETS